MDMYCNQCGKQLPEGSKFCSFCGKEQKSVQEQETQESQKGQNHIQEAMQSDGQGMGKEESEQVADVVSMGKEDTEQAADREGMRKEDREQKPTSKKKFIALGVGVAALIIGVVCFVFYNMEVQAQSWENWVSDYKEEMATYYLSEEQGKRLDDFVLQSVQAEKKEAQKLLKEEMNLLKEKVIKDNEKYQADIAAGLEQVASGYDLKFAYEEELNQIEQLQAEIKRLQEAKDYPEALEQIEECKALEEQIQTVKSGWNVSVVQRDISEYPKVKLYLDIRDEIGSPIENLNQKIFFLSQKDAASGEYIKREVTSALQLNENESININLVADVSGSMYENMYAVKGIMSNFLNTVQFGVGDQIALTQFSDTSFVTQNFTSNKDSIVSQINGMGSYGGTKLYDTLIESVMRVYGQSGAKCVIAFTDGLDNRSLSQPEEVVRVAQETGIPIFIIGIGYDVDNALLSYIANSTGGYYTNAIDVSTMQDIYNSIYARQKQVYCLEYQAQEENMMMPQDLSIYLRGETQGGTVTYAYTPSDDFFDMLLNNYLNSYIEALTVGDPSIMSQAGYASTEGGVFKETSQYIQKNKEHLSEQLIQSQVMDVVYKDKDTYEITSNEIYDIQWIRDFTNEIATDTSEEGQQARDILMGYYPEEYLQDQFVKIYKSRTLKGHYSVKRLPEGKWQIADFTGSYEVLDSNVYNAHIDGEE